MSMLKISCDTERNFPPLEKLLMLPRERNTLSTKSHRVLSGSFAYVDYASQLISNAMFVAKRLCFAFQEKSFQIQSVCSAHPQFSSLYRGVDEIIKTS